jgi:hypothetical protein
MQHRSVDGTQSVKVNSAGVTALKIPCMCLNTCIIHKLARDSSKQLSIQISATFRPALEDSRTTIAVDEVECFDISRSVVCDCCGVFSVVCVNSASASDAQNAADVFRSSCGELAAAHREECIVSLLYEECSAGCLDRRVFGIHSSGR